MTTRVSGFTWPSDKRWCRWFGHKVSGYRGGPPYGKVTAEPRDGIGRVHCYVSATCDRCGQDRVVIKFHLPDSWISDRGDIGIHNAPANHIDGIDTVRLPEDGPRS